VGTPVKVAPGIFDVTFELRVRNYGAVVLSKVQVTDDLVATFAGQATYTVKSLTSSGFTVNPAFNGDSDKNLLSASATNNTLPVGTSYKTIKIILRVNPTGAGPFNNSAEANGRDLLGNPVTDISQDGTDPDNSVAGPPGNNGDRDPTNNNDPTPISFAPRLFDPPLGIKTVDDAGLPVLRWTMVWINETNIPALRARISDPISSGTEYAGNLVCTPASALTTIKLCAFEPPSVTYPRGRIVWEGTLGPDQGATDAETAKNELTISFNVNVQPGTTRVHNEASIDADLNGDGIYDPGTETRLSLAQADWSKGSKAKKLPSTGFAPGIVSNIPAGPGDAAYQTYSSLIIEIPALNIKTDIVGVPFSGGYWDTTWLGTNAGYLVGTSFPTWQGNSVITGHVYAYNGQPGPFVNLGKLNWGSQIVIHAFDQKYIYEVRSVSIVKPDDVSVLGHKDNSWVTLLTCKEYDAATGIYKLRTVVQAVLVKVVEDTGK
jgi:LPXTG-site transpeptidase (sortase) family protein